MIRYLYGLLIFFIASATFALPANAITGDVNNDGQIDLADTLLALQISSGMSPSSVNINLSADVDGDQKIGMAEAIFATSSLISQKILIDFGLTPTTEGNWNSIDTLSGSFPLINDKGETTGVSLVTIQDFSPPSKEGDPQNTLGYPGTVSLDSFWLSRWRDPSVFELRNLKPTSEYKLTFFGTRKSYDGFDRIARFTIGDVSKDLVTADNLGNVVVFEHIVPDESGVISVTLDVSPESVTDDGYISSLILESGAGSSPPQCIDADGDGYPAIFCGGIEEDCDDSDNRLYPNAVEICDDGLDNNCDGLTDTENVVLCPSTCVAETEVCDNGKDDDCDLLIDGFDPDCGAVTSCSDNIRNNGEVGVDCGGPCTACVSPRLSTCREIPFERPLKILFIGNSFTSQGPIYSMVRDLATSGGFITPTVDYRVMGGQNLATHRADETTLSKVDGGGWDFVVLQDFSRRGFEDAQGLKDDVLWFYDRIKQNSPNAHVVLYETWTYPESSDYVTYGFGGSITAMQNAISATYHSAAYEYVPAHSTSSVKTDIEVAHVGDVWLSHLLGSNPLELYNGYHASINGQYINALALYSTIFQTKVAGVDNWQLSSADATRLQTLVDESSVSDCTPVDSASFYVDANHGLDTNDGSVSHPFKTFSKLMTVISEGDTAIFSDGEYGDIELGKNADLFSDWVTFKAAPGHNPHISKLHLGSGRYDFYENMDNELFVRFIGFSLYPTANVLGASHVELIDLTVKGATSPVSVAAPTGIYVSHSFNVLVEGCDISHVGHGIATNYWSSDIVLKNNHIHEASHDGIQLVSTQNILVEGNIIHNLDDGLSDTDPDPDSLNRHCDGIHIYPQGSADKNFMTNITIRGNTIYNVENSIIQWNPKLRDDGLPTHYNYVVENNIFGPGCNGYAVNMDSSMVVGGYFIFRHNTVLPIDGASKDYTGVTGRYLDCGDSSVRFRVQLTGRGGNGVYYPIDVYNNLLSSSSGLYLQLTDASKIFNEGNILLGTGTIPTSGQFTDLESYNGLLLQSSDAINAGVVHNAVIPEIGFDKNGVVRDSSPDVGAIEYSW